MFTGITQSTSIPILEQVVQFSEARHTVLAGNLANVDTPGYRSRDLSVETFQDRLKEAVTSLREGTEHATPGIDRETPEGDPMRQVKDSMKTILFHDDHDVGLEQQVTEISKNQMMHNMAIAIMSSQYNLLQMTISERV